MTCFYELSRECIHTLYRAGLVYATELKNEVTNRSIKEYNGQNESM